MGAFFAWFQCNDVAELEKAKQKKMKIRYFMEDCMEVK